MNNDPRIAEAYILDLFNNGKQLVFSIKEFTPYRVNHWASIADYNNVVNTIYKEITTQILLALSEDEDIHALYNIMALPDYEPLSRLAIYQCFMPELANQFTEHVKKFAMFLKGEIDFRVNPLNAREPCDYHLDSLTETMIVIAKFKRVT